MNVTETELAGILLIEPKVYGDERGYFMETWNQARYAEHGIRDLFVQDNLSYSARGVLRGLHFQKPHAQGKLVYVLQGAVWDVAVDIRVGSPTFGHWVGLELSAENKRQLYIPPNYAHGFCVTSENALFAYKCTELYNPAAEGSIAWNDADIGIEWPPLDFALSEKDAKAPTLKGIDQSRLPVYRAP